VIDFFELREKKKITYVTLYRNRQPTAYDRMSRNMNPQDTRMVDASDKKQIKDLKSQGFRIIEMSEAYKTPAEAGAIAAGKKAARQGKKFSDNPHKKGTPEFTAWSKGHNMARESVELGESSMASNAYVVAVKDPKGWKVVFAGSKKDQSKEIKKMKADGKVIGKDFRGYMSPRSKVGDIIKESMVREKKEDYPLYHKTYSDAMRAAYEFAKKKGYEVDPDDIDRKVASGPRKPSNGKTNSFTLKLKDEKRKMLAVQVTNLDNKRYELNTYIT